MTITAKNIGRINVWPTYAMAREADTEESKFVGQLTVWRTNEEAQANISHEEEGGSGGAPAWVPANAVIHIDLVGGTPQGRAWVAGTGEVAVDTLFGSDPNTAEGWNATSYNPANLTADGLVLGTPPAFIGAARTKILTGATVRFTIKLLGISGQDKLSFPLTSADGNDSIFVEVTGQRLQALSFGGDVFEFQDTLNIGEGAINTLAVTMTGMRMEAAANGIEPVVAATLLDVDRPAANPMVACLLNSTIRRAISSFTIYDPLPSTAGLSDLSEV